MFGETGFVVVAVGLKVKPGPAKASPAPAKFGLVEAGVNTVPWAAFVVPWINRAAKPMSPTFTRARLLMNRTRKFGPAPGTTVPALFWLISPRTSMLFTPLLNAAFSAGIVRK